MDELINSLKMNMLKSTTLKETVTLNIPENLDIDALIEKDQTGFYGQGLKREMLLFICSELLESRAQYRKEMLEKNRQYAPLCTCYLKEVVYNYAEHLSFLLDQGVLITDNSFTYGSKCKGYRFANRYSGQKLKQIEVFSNLLKRAIQRTTIRREKEYKKNIWGYSYLIKWWQTGKLEIDEQGAFEWIEIDRLAKLKDLAEQGNVVDEQKKINDINDTAEDFKQIVKSINKGISKPEFSGRSHRFYNRISNLKKGLRQFLTYDGQYLVDADIKNSQPFLSLVLLKISFWMPKKKVEKGQICLEELDKEMYEELKKGGVLQQIIILLESLEKVDYEDNSIKKFSELVVSGEFYEYIQEQFHKVHAGRFETRDQTKIEVLRILYMNPKKDRISFYKPCQTFREHFPEVYKLFSLIKSIDYTYLPIILQRLESFLVLDVICKEINRLYPHIPFFTIHDNIITTKGNEALVKAIMQEQIAKWTGYTPKLDSKDLVPLLLPQRVE
jgi:hypothetical protein